MSTPLIAVAVREDGTISPHAGRAIFWQVYAVETDQPEHVWDIILTEAGCLHEWHVRGDGNRHPLHSVDIAIAGSGGEGVTRRLAERYTELVSTTQMEPFQAVLDYLAGQLKPGGDHDETECLDPESHRAKKHAAVSGA